MATDKAPEPNFCLAIGLCLKTKKEHPGDTKDGRWWKKNGVVPGMAVTHQSQPQSPKTNQPLLTKRVGACSHWCWGLILGDSSTGERMTSFPLDSRDM